MKKSTLVVLLVLIALSGTAIYIYFFRNADTSVEGADRNFRYKDTASINKIFIADKEGNTSLLERKKEGWIVNNKFPARGEAVLNLLEVIRNIEVKMSVPKEGRENVIKFMSYNAIKVEIYSDNDLVRQYYVGHEAPDGDGSYMLLTNLRSGKNHDIPYICVIPGFIGYMQPRYIATENLWRDKLVINYVPPDIKSVTVRHLQEPADSSFTIELLSTTEFSVKDGTGKELKADNDRVKQFLMYLQNVSYESLITGKNIKLQDSLTKVKPFAEILVNTKKFNEDVYRFYRRPYRGDLVPDMGVPYDYDPDRMYMSFNGENDWAVTQYYVMGKLMITSRYFQPDATVKK